tara:strand:- start:307 stop:1125 length:819 start_codon:yes stop_codon:yes gene_type:complete
MSVRVEKNQGVWTIIHSRPENRNAMDPTSADHLTDAFLEFNENDDGKVAVFWGEGGAFCAGWDLKFASTLNEKDPLKDLDIKINDEVSQNCNLMPRGPMGPSRLNLKKPVIGAIAGPAVAGGMELALWCDFRVMEVSSYLGVYCRRWGIPLIDGGTIRLPRIIGRGRALEIILTGRQVKAEECLALGLCEYIVENGQSRQKAEALAHQIARFPQVCVQADRSSVYAQEGLSMIDALKQEWFNGKKALSEEGLNGANNFKKGFGRHGDFDKLG